ncbi:MAG: Sec-independent protein translocase protein TatB [Candidatus Hydrogenedentes bacterium]|nr:Sec-independent protein translocase protein TatB [Candidatus Hydrogenedentota bacterium]
MFGSIGFTEILVIAAVALVILGPDKFPGHAKIAMRFIRDIRGYWDEAKRDLAQELKPVKKEIKELEKYKPEDYLDTMITDTVQDTSYDGQGYPYSSSSKTTETKSAEESATKSDSPGEADPEAAQTESPSESPASSPEGTQPYQPESDYDESQRFPD